MEGEIDAPRYVDGDDREVTAKQAADDLAEYRREKAKSQADDYKSKAKDLLAEMTGEPTQEHRGSIRGSAEQLPELTAEEKAQHERQQKATEGLEQAQAAKRTFDHALKMFIAHAQGANLEQFSDIRSEADLMRVAAQDPARFQRWQQVQHQIMTAQQQLAQSQAAEQQSAARMFETFAAEQDRRVADLIPELKDPAKAKELREGSLQTLRAAGFGDQELAASWHGRDSFTLRDKRVQRVIADAAKWRSHEEKMARHGINPNGDLPKKALPPVQRPGVARERDPNAHLAAFENQFRHTGSLRDAARLVAARRRGT